MAPWSSKKAVKGREHSSNAAAGAATGKSRNGNGEEAKGKLETKPAASTAVASKKEHDPNRPHVPVKLSRPSLPFLFALFLNQFYINLIVLVPRQVGIYIIQQRF